MNRGSTRTPAWRQLTCGGAGHLVLVAVLLVGLGDLGLGDGRGRGLGLLVRPALECQDAMVKRGRQLPRVLRAGLEGAQRTGKGEWTCVWLCVMTTINNQQ